MIEKKNLLIIILISLLVIFIAYAGRELAKQTIERESLARELSEIKKDVEIKEKTSFVQCREIKIPREDIVEIYLLGVLEIGKRRVWDLVVINPTGYGVGGRDFPMEAARMGIRTPFDVNGDGILDDTVYLGERETGDYLVIITLGIDTSPTDTYGLQLSNLVLAKDVPFSNNLFDRLFILRQTETGIIPIVPASIGCQF